MYRNYFEMDGKRYYTGTVFIIKNILKNPVQATFAYYDTERCRYVFNADGRKFFWSQELFYRDIVEVTNVVNDTIHMPQTKTLADSQISGMSLGWLWYIFLMAIATIFKDNIGLWLLITAVFFNWRCNKKKKEGTYIEW